MGRRLGLAGLLLLLAVAAGPAQQNTGHYVNGVEGLKAASLPPFPGWYYRVYNAYYHAGRNATPTGLSAPIGFNVDVFASVHRLIWLSDFEIFGGQYGADIAVPLINTDLQITGVPLSASDFGVGDVYVEPFLLAWHGPRYDTAVALATYVPIGDFSATNPASPGKDMWTFMPTFGGTYYLTPERDWSISALGRYEWHTEIGNTGIKPGNDFHLEWGLSHTVPTKAAVWDLGVAGYCQWQVNNDSGPGASPNRDRVFAAGPEIDVFLPDREFIVQGRLLWEFGARDRSEGWLADITTTFMFF